jgi:hypothetical protein
MDSSWLVHELSISEMKCLVSRKGFDIPLEKPELKLLCDKIEECHECLSNPRDSIPQSLFCKECLKTKIRKKLKTLKNDQKKFQKIIKENLKCKESLKTSLVQLKTSQEEFKVNRILCKNSEDWTPLILENQKQLRELETALNNIRCNLKIVQDEIQALSDIKVTKRLEKSKSKKRIRHDDIIIDLTETNYNYPTVKLHKSTYPEDKLLDKDKAKCNDVFFHHLELLDMFQSGWLLFLDSPTLFTSRNAKAFGYNDKSRLIVPNFDLLEDDPMVNNLFSTVYKMDLRRYLDKTDLQKPEEGFTGIWLDMCCKFKTVQSEINTLFDRNLLAKICIFGITVSTRGENREQYQQEIADYILKLGKETNYYPLLLDSYIYGSVIALFFRIVK